ncbi:hypothetical protein [Rhodoferax ferrireducens]|nr:hypothetical protein [Rhodoferax ferrireducens]
MIPRHSHCAVVKMGWLGAYITHDIDDVLALADIAFVIENGQAVREVDVRHGEGREIAQRLLPKIIVAPPSARERAVRTLLRVPAHGWRT